MTKKKNAFVTNEETSINDNPSNSFLNLPHEIRNLIVEEIPESVGTLCLVSKQIHEEIISSHGPRIEKFNHYLSIFGGQTQKKNPTFTEYFQQLEMVKDPFLEKQQIEIDKIKQWKKDSWALISPKLKKDIDEIKTLATNLSEVIDRETLLNDMHIQIIRSKIETLTEENTYLDLSALGLTRLPKQLFIEKQWEIYWKNCTRLDLQKNHITTLPVEFMALEELQTLNLSNNQIDVLPNEIQHLKNLQVLNLGSNQLNTIPDGIADLKKLELLDLSNNNLCELPEKLSDLEKIMFLDLKNNFLSKETIQRFIPLLNNQWAHNTSLAQKSLNINHLKIS